MPKQSDASVTITEEVDILGELTNSFITSRWWPTKKTKKLMLLRVLQLLLPNNFRASQRGAEMAQVQRRRRCRPPHPPRHTHADRHRQSVSVSKNLNKLTSLLQRQPLGGSV